MTERDRTEFARVMSIFNPPPVVRIEDYGTGPTLSAAEGLVWISHVRMKVRSVRGEVEVPGYMVEVALPPSGETQDVGEFRTLNGAMLAGAKVYAEKMAEIKIVELLDEHYAEESSGPDSISPV